jgi:cell shape-determining protein MreD
MRRIIPFLLYLFLIAAHQVMLRDITSIHTVDINLTALVVLVVSVYKTELVVAWFGLAAGMVLSAQNPEYMGWSALWLTGLGLAGFHARDKLNVESLYARLLLVGCGVLLHNLLVMVTASGLADFWFKSITEALPGAVYTTLVAWLFFLIKEGHITWAKVKALF